ncbi:MAG: class I SAM-dependent methyltransferase [Rhodoluna sp.]
MPNNHYFSESADEQLRLKKIKVKLYGNKYELSSSTGIFSPNELDTGTEVLLKQLDEIKPQGTILDVGCGWGPIALSLALASPKAKIVAIDVNQKSLALTKINAEALGLNNIEVCTPEVVKDSLMFDEIWSNPPIRVGKKVLHEILATWLPRLKPGGSARLVVQKNLGSDSLQKWLENEFSVGFQISRIASIKGFRVLKVTRD